METLTTTKFLERLPSSLTSDLQVQSLASAVDSDFPTLATLATRVIILPYIAQQSDDVLDVLAIHLAVIGYQQNFSTTTKAALISQSLMTHRQRGTSGAIRRVIDSIFPAGMFDLQEGSDYDGGMPYHFAIIANGTAFSSNELQTQLANAIAAVKNARSIFDGIILTQSISATVYVGCAYSTFKYTHITER